MKYQDNAISVNGFYVGESVGTRLTDSLSPTDDGLDYVRGIEHVGTITSDTIDPNLPKPLNESEDES